MILKLYISIEENTKKSILQQMSPFFVKQTQNKHKNMKSDHFTQLEVGQLC